jgi:hypothetical protein
MRHGSQLQRFLLVVVAGMFVMLFQRCGGDDPVTPSKIVDYFPMNRNLVWTFTTNIMAPRGVPELIFEMKADTATYYNGPFNLGCHWWYFSRVPSQSPEWRHFWVLKDSANTIYTWGDYPSQSSPPITLGWKPVYEESEGTREMITIQGNTYRTVRIDVTTDEGVPISWWFADGIGLVKEYSPKGGSIFTDDYFGDDVIMNTELVSYTK